MKNQKTYSRPKRTTLLKLLAGNTLLAVLATGIFSAGFYYEELREVDTQVRNELSDCERRIVNKIMAEDMQDKITSLDAYLPAFTYYDIILFDSAKWQLIPEYSENCYAISAIVDNNKEIVYSSKEKFAAVFKLSEDADAPERGWYSCGFEEAPDFHQAYRDFLIEGATENPQNTYDYVSVKLKSAYVNKEQHKFLPHEAELIYEAGTENDEIAPEVLVDYEETKSKTVTFDYEKEGYELTTFTAGMDEGVPFSLACNVYGTPEPEFNDIFNGVMSRVNFKTNGMEQGMYGLPDAKNLSVFSETSWINYSVIPVQINGETKNLVTAFQVDFWNEQTERLFFKTILIFFLICEALAILVSLHKNKINQLAYRYEDYQRTLTNNLAHDLKTPLMAIQGYAENLIASYKMEDQPKQYLKSIIENVGYTDSLINQTLELNKMQGIKTLKKNSCNLKQLTEQALKKYELLLEERNIQVTTEGEAEISANPETMTTAIENLISNAVKYTAKGGEMKINLSKKAFEIINSVTSKTDTSELLMPFTRGDKSRTNPSGHGLGLSIANQALLANGFKLEISCTDTEFTAKIHF